MQGNEDSSEILMLSHMHAPIKLFKNPPIAFILVLATPQSMSLLAGASLNSILKPLSNNFLFS